MKPEDIKNKKIAVLCDTLEKANKFLEICIEKRYYKMEESSMSRLISEKRNCLALGYGIGLVYFYTEEWCESHDYTIITFDEFLTGEMRDIPLTAVEVLEVLVNEYKGRKYNEIFGCNPCFSVLISDFTPAEIVQKVTEWKRKQDNKTQITEDMIADALDEKYGVGNWRRE